MGEFFSRCSVRSLLRFESSRTSPRLSPITVRARTDGSELPAPARASASDFSANLINRRFAT
eukprot:509983-Hanusia_phi.AAC.2